MLCACDKCRQAVSDAVAVLSGVSAPIALVLWGTIDPVRLAFSRGWLCC